MVRGDVEPRDRFGAAMEQVDRRVEVAGDDVLTARDRVDHELAELVEVGDLHVLAGLLEDVLHLVEGHPLAPGRRADALELVGTVTLRREEPGVHQPTRRVQDRRSEQRPVLHEVVMERLGEAAHRSLRCRIDRCGGYRRETPVPRRSVDDLPRLPRLDHSRHELADTDAHAEDVDAEAPAPVVGLHLPRLAAAPRGDARVVEEEVAAPEGREDMICERAHRSLVRDIGLPSRDRALGAELVDGGIQYGLFDVGDHDRGPVPGEGLHHTLADAAGAAGDDGDRSRYLDICDRVVAHAAFFWFSGLIPGQPFARSGMSP